MTLHTHAHTHKTWYLQNTWNLDYTVFIFSGNTKLIQYKEHVKFWNVNSFIHLIMSTYIQLRIICTHTQYKIIQFIYILLYIIISCYLILYNNTLYITYTRDITYKFYIIQLCFPVLSVICTIMNWYNSIFFQNDYPNYFH